MHELPEITARRESDGALELDFTLAADCPWLEGHFPGRSVLPGVVQIGWAAHFSKDLLASTEPPACLSRIKFRRPLLPGAAVTLRLERHGQSVRYAYTQRLDGVDQRVSDGVLAHPEAA